MKKIVFFLQSKQPVGGGHLLYLDLARSLSDNYGYEAYYINYRHDKVERDYKDSNIHFIDVEKFNDYQQFEDAIFFVSINYIFYLLTKIRDLPNAKIYVYFFHPHILRFLTNQIYYKNNNVDEFLRLIYDENSYGFMDKSNFLSAVRASNVPFEERYVPVCHHVADVPEYSPTELTNDKEINIGWLGRLDMDKIHSVVNLANNLKDYAVDKKINIHLIGDGNAKRMLRLNDYAPNIKFILTSYMYGEKRNKYFRDHVDIVVAMGVSAIDIAVLGIPTVIPIVSRFPFKDDKFVYLYDTMGYSLGWDKEDISGMDCKYYRISEIIDQVYNGNEKIEIGKKCADYSKMFFSQSNSSDLFVSELERVQLTVKKCLSCKPIHKELKSYDLYVKIRKNRDFAMFHEFIMRVNRIQGYKGIGKIRFLAAEFLKTYGKKKGK